MMAGTFARHPLYIHKVMSKPSFVLLAQQQSSI